MPRNEDLHGNAPDKSDVVLILIDVIIDFEFVDGDKLYKNALPMAQKLSALKKKAKKAGIPVVYVNDNFGKWQSDFKKLLAQVDTRSLTEINFAELSRAA